MDARNIRNLTDDQLREITRTLRAMIFPQPDLPSREQQDAVHYFACARLEIRRRAAATRLSVLRQFLRR